jgi:hypothetical protein
MPNQSLTCFPYATGMSKELRNNDWISIQKLPAIVCLHVFTTITLLWRSGLSLDVSKLSIQIPISILVIYTLSYRLKHRFWIYSRYYLEDVTGFALISASGAVNAYALAKMSSGYTDHILDLADHILGLDWVAAYRLVATHMTARIILSYAYDTIRITPVILLTILAVTGNRHHSRNFVFLFGVTLYITVWVSFFFPCASTLQHYFPGGGAPFLTALGYEQFKTIEAMRRETLSSIDLQNLIGLVNFPSFHAASAILITWGSWPVRFARWPMLLVNLAMIIATPIEGNHYFVDVIAGTTLPIIIILLFKNRSRIVGKYKILARLGAPPFTGQRSSPA